MEEVSMTLPGSDALLEQVAQRMGLSPDPRLRQILILLVKHLHAFAREAQLTEQEWMRGIEFLTATGQKCDATRQEFILLSDVLGLSMQVVAINSGEGSGAAEVTKTTEATEATVLGPFHTHDAPAYANGEDIANGAKGQPCRVRGSVCDRKGRGIAGATVEVWQSDDDGLYDVQRAELSHPQARGVLKTDENGRFWFQSIVPMPYPIPTDGPVGALLLAAERSPTRPAHLHVKISADGYRSLTTHIFRRGDPHLASDPVFGVRDSLVADWRADPDDRIALDYDFVLSEAV
jgi:hydroxyquinol 1,2-dioxygenase